MDQFQSLGKQVVDAVAHDGVGLAAADFHEHPGSRAAGGDLAGEGARDPTVPVFVQILHSGPNVRLETTVARGKHAIGDADHMGW